MPLDGTGAPSASGVTELVAGMGGHAHSRWTTTDSRVVASDNTHYGALRLDLNGAGAAYRFESTGGQVLDSGSVQCNSTAIDTTAPTAPTGLLAVGTYKTSVSLSWSAGYDSVGVTGHQIFRDGQPLATVGPGTSYTDETVAAGSTHTYQVRAVDAAGNVSPPSNTSSATTPLNAVLFHDGFESGDFSQWTVASNLVIQSDNVFAGSLAAEATPVASPAPYAMRQLPAPEQNLYYATRFQVLDQPTGNINLLRFRAANGPTYSSLATFYVTATDRIGMRNDVSGTSTTSTAVATRGQWHTLQVHVVVNGTASQTEVWLDGTPVAALTASNVAFGVYTAIGQVELGAKATSSSTYDVALDEVAYDRDPIGDATPPDIPGSFAATAHSGLRVDLTWTASRDDIGTVAYDIYRDGLPVATVGPVTGFADTTVAAAHLVHLRGRRTRRGGQRQRAQPDAVGDDAGRVRGRLRVRATCRSGRARAASPCSRPWSTPAPTPPRRPATARRAHPPPPPSTPARRSSTTGPASTCSAAAPTRSACCACATPRTARSRPRSSPARASSGCATTSPRSPPPAPPASPPAGTSCSCT